MRSYEKCNRFFPLFELLAIPVSNQTTQQALALPEKEAIQPHLSVRLPFYDFTPVTSPAFDIPSLRLRKRLRAWPAPIV
ncbi:hypothetical protein Ahy_B10g100858 [Arachis hypogaea]|uniref:Uncharacterized protein n=1 Tax=Arachis hypogaea TaxID=3818 RepID=A0A444WXY6_ARAHY|nr:hypothetical protein Ahy_B10g100858 [Arachis hypogaea]